MKIIKRMAALVMAFALLMSFNCYASELSWESVPGTHNESVLLPSDETSAADSYQSLARGDFLSSGTLEISNLQNGSIHISIDTYAHHVVDSIFHTLFLDQWDADNEDWVQVGYWDFEKTKAEDSNLHELNTSLTLTGYETNKYYRARGLHGVEYNDEIEACATETNGVLITDGPT